MGAEPKTKPTKASVDKFIYAIADETRRDDARAVLEMMKQVTREEPIMWGTAIIGFGTHHYIGASGKGADWPVVAFSPRKQNLVLYIMNGFERYRDLIAKLGKCKTSKACLYVNKLEQVDRKVLKEIVKHSVAYVKALDKKKA